MNVSPVEQASAYLLLICCGRPAGFSLLRRGVPTKTEQAEACSTITL
jgi:hypothetical protein